MPQVQNHYAPILSSVVRFRSRRPKREGARQAAIQNVFSAIRSGANSQPLHYNLGRIAVPQGAQLVFPSPFSLPSPSHLISSRLFPFRLCSALLCSTLPFSSLLYFSLIFSSLFPSRLSSPLPPFFFLSHSALLFPFPLFCSLFTSFSLLPSLSLLSLLLIFPTFFSLSESFLSLSLSPSSPPVSLSLSSFPLFLFALF